MGISLKVGAVTNLIKDQNVNHGSGLKVESVKVQVCGSRNLVNRDTLLFAIDFNPSLFRTLQPVIQSGLSL